MKSGMLCGEAVFEAIAAGVEKGGDLAIARVTEGEDFFVKELTSYTDKFNNSWLKEELYSARNFYRQCINLVNGWAVHSTSSTRTCLKSRSPYMTWCQTLKH